MVITGIVFDHPTLGHIQAFNFGRAEWWTYGAGQSFFDAMKAAQPDCGDTWNTFIWQRHGFTSSDWFNVGQSGIFRVSAGPCPYPIIDTFSQP